MTQERLLQMVTSVLLTAGFDISERCDIRPRSFDLVARKDDILLIIKVISHIDSISEEIASDLRFVAVYLKGKPLIVGERTRDAELERGAVYIRYGVNALSISTLYDYLVEGNPPLVYASPGGLYVNINGDQLRALRERHQMSLGEMAGILGVSRRTISKYESGMGTTLDIAIKIEEHFDKPIVEAIDPLAYDDMQAMHPSAATEPLPMDLTRIGLELHPTHRAPFQAFALYERETILTGYGTTQKVVRRAALIGNLSEITNTRAMCVITDYKKKKRVGKTLIIGEERLHSLDSGSELMELIDE
jgi:putative transcriptional regulator